MTEIERVEPSREDAVEAASHPAFAGGEVVDRRRGMFGARDTGDTSGYGGLRRLVSLPGPTPRPYGHGHPQRKDYPLGGIPVEYKGADIPPPDQRRVYS